MQPTNTILAAIDFSPCSAAALKQAIRIAAWKNATLSALHVVNLPMLLPADPVIGGGLVMPLPVQDDLVAVARDRWKGFSRQCGAPDLPLDIEVGSPRDRILQAVRERRPALLLVGAHSAASARRAVGTTAAACAQRAQTQVMIVRESQSGPSRAVAACIDFSDSTRTTIEEAIGIAAEDSAALHILHIYSDPWHGLTPPDEIRQNMPGFADRYRTAIVDRLKSACEGLTHELSALHPTFHAEQAPSHAEGIIAFVTQNNCDMAVLGTRGRWTLRDFFWGSTAERVVREAPCSVLATKPPAHTATDTQS